MTQNQPVMRERWGNIVEDAAQLACFCRAAAAEPGSWGSEATTALCAEAPTQYPHAPVNGRGTS